MIPDHYEEEFVTTLVDPSSLTLVMEIDGILVGCGSVSYQRQGNHYGANLSFGIIHPDYQGRTLGSILLVSRLSLLSENAGHCLVYLSAIESSVGFFADVVGFAEYDRSVDKFGNRFFELSLEVGPVRLQDAREYVAGSDFAMEPDLLVPVTEVVDPLMWSREW